MIRVSRETFTAPQDLVNQWLAATGRLRKFFAALPPSPTQRIQSTPEFEPNLWQEATSIIRAVFRDKCAYCETPIPATASTIDHFRTKGGAVNLNGQKSPEHYWWLAYEWRNLYLACNECVLAKANKFPVKGPRMEIDTDWSQTNTEKAMLLDPCSDDPEKHLVFSEEGFVAAATERGEVTIDVLNLNRPGLISQRQSEIKTVRDQLTSWFSIGITDAESKLALTSSVSFFRPFAAACRQCVHRWIRERQDPFKRTLTSELRKTILSVITQTSPFVSSKKVEDLTKRYKAAEYLIARTSPKASRSSRRFFFERSQFITGIEIHNFRVIRDLKIELNPVESQKPWLIFLGENGTGKSSILKAVTLALMTDEQRRAHGLEPAQFLSHKSQSGYIKVHLTGYRKPFELHFRRGSNIFQSNQGRLHTLLFGYGGTRLLPYGSYERRNGDTYSRVGNLFNPFLPLTDAKSWLLSLRDKQFEYSARAIRKLLQHEGQGELRRRRGKQAAVKLVFDSLNISSTLEHLSDGYQSIVALAADIMEVMLDHWDAVEDAEGIVLIDEIDAHLHPRWKIEILELLRNVFPRVQFILTTHDPLCLVGSLPGEVHVLRRDTQSRQIVVQQKDIPRGRTADQILTGFWFGLSSTVDVDTLRLLDEHRSLMRAGAQETDLRRRQLETELRKRLGIFADTSLERMVQSVCAEIMQEEIAATDRRIDPAIRSQIRENILRIVRERQLKDK